MLRPIPAVVAALLLAAGGCGGNVGAFVWIDDPSVVQKNSTQQTYAIGENDVLLVQVFNHAEMSGRTKVRSDGNVSIGLLGDVAAVGKSPAGLAREIEKQLDAKSLAVAARVTILLDEAAPVRISILGEVSRPGMYNLESGAGLSEALATSGGFTDFAHRDRLFVLRRSPEPMRIRFTFEDLSRGKGEAARFRLRSGDTIVVE
jgi:polysaccharide export outer membrane protein